MRVAIVGGRDYDEDFDVFDDLLNNTITEHTKSNGIEIVSGGARGVDSMAERYAEHHGLTMKVFKADWDRYSRSAGYIRNAEIAKYSDMCIALWDGKSKGTKNTISLFKKMNKTVVIIKY